MILPKTRLGLAFALGLALAACNSGKRQNPVPTEDVGQVSEDAFSATDEKPTTYTAREGDTLRKIAGRPEIYADPDLWPVLQEANADIVGQSTRVNKGTVLSIPRDLSPAQIEDAREKARQVAAASKQRRAPRKKPEAREEPTPEPRVAEVRPTPVPPQPLPKPKKGGMLLPVLLILLLILAALAGVLYWFMKRDSQEQNQ